ncbi:MAG: hypothetical protein EPO32_11475 [Anaerolineae bacterium]|nr:MAG: hypothetical protein EPO32_11475 [Anaerolineae bacterium]
MTSLVSRTVRRADLTAEERQEMHGVFREYYEGATMELFDRDLENKDWVILLLDNESHGVQGFSTLAFYTTSFEGAPCSVVYSGDTIIRSTHWGSPELPRAWVRTVLEKSAEMPQPLYWLLISSGYKTYRFLSLFYKDFFPRHDTPTPPAMRDLIHFLANERFGSAYDRVTGIVHLGDGATPLKSGVAEVSKERMQDSHIAFFVQQNPGHGRGDELVCLARVHPDNFTAAGRRMTR